MWSSNSTSGRQPRIIESKILKRYTYFYFFNWRTVALLCCVSAAQQHELAVSIHTSPLSRASLSPLGLIPGHRVELPALYRSFPLSIYFTHAVCSVVSDSLRPHGLEPARLLCPWNFSGRNTGVGCHFLLQGIFSARDRIHVSCISRQILYQWATGKASLMSWCTPVFKWCNSQ